MKTTTLILCLGLLAQGALGAQESAVSNTVKVCIHTTTTLFKGLPFFMALEVTNEGQQQVEFPEWNVLQAHLPLTIQLQGPNGHDYSSRVDRYGFILAEVETDRGARPIFRQKRQLPPGASRRFLANVGPTLERLKLPSGQYKLRIRLLQDLDKPLSESDPIEIRVADFPSQELSALTKKTPLTTLGATDMKEGLTSKDIEPLASKELREVVGLSSLLHNIRTIKDISTLPIQDYRDLVGPWLLPEIEQIQFEVLLARHEKDKAALVKEAVLKRSPAMKWWIDEAERGQGYCHTIRQMK